MARVDTVVVPKPEFDDLVARVEELENLSHARFHEIERLLTAIDVAEKNTEDRQAEVERLREELLDARTKKLAELGGDFSTIKDQRDTWKRRFEEQKEAFAAEHAEVERLRAR